MTKFRNLTFKIDSGTEFRLRRLKQKLEKERKEPVTFNELFKAMLDGVEFEERAVVDEGVTVSVKSKSRYVPVAVKKPVEAEHKGCCSFPGCNKPAEVMHHTKRFASSGEHNTEYLKPLCRCHHDIAHAGLIAGELGPIEEWRLRDVMMPCFIDRKVIAHRV